MTHGFVYNILLLGVPFSVALLCWWSTLTLGSLLVRARIRRRRAT